MKVHKKLPQTFPGKNRNLVELSDLVGFSAWEMIDPSEKITIESLASAEPALLPLTHDPALVNRLHIEALYEHAVAEQYEEVKEVKEI